MRWRLLRSRPEQADDPKVAGPKYDKLSMAIRQRRIWSAQERVRALPGFLKLEHRWCAWPAGDELNQRFEGLGDDGTVERWADGESLAAALRTASSLAPDTAGFALFHDEPDAHWLEARLGDLLAAMSVALPALHLGGAILAADNRAFCIDLRVDTDAGDRVSHETRRYGEWPAEIIEALTPTMPR